MTHKKSTKRALLFSAFSLLVCVAMFIGTTFAWFTDSVTSTGNKIEAGTLKIDLLLKDGDDDWTSIKDSNKAIFDYNNWEPGYTDVKVLKIVNEGSLALKWLAKFMSASGTELTALADVIDVYVNTSVQDMPTDRAAISTWENVGTVREFVNTIKETTKGELTAESAAYLGIALKMRESAGNEYQGMDLGGAFDIQIIATQLTYEKDSFDELYDEDATLDFAPVSNAAELRAALNNNEPNIVLTKNILIDGNFPVNYNPTINGDGYMMYRIDESLPATFSTEPTVYTGAVFEVAAGATLTLEDVVVDGGAIWTGAEDSVLKRGTENTGVVSTGSLVKTAGNGSVVLAEGAVLQNHNGADAVVNLATRGNGTLTLNGGKIINNTVTNGATIWLGGATIVNDGSEISGNSGTLGGVFRSVDSQNRYDVSVTVNGGKITNNTAPTGGVLWSGNNIKVTFAGGEIAYNHATSAGGVIWGGSADKYYITGDVEIHHNTAGELGNAFRLNHYKYPVLEMTGGKIYDNTSAATPYAIYCINDTVSLLGGEIKDDILYTGGVGLTMGLVDIDGTIHYDLATNHKTAYLAKEFNSFKFTVADNAEHYTNFNFKPAADYVYTEGDEAKLICQNAGYETYWDATTSTFRLKAI